jgi:vitamin B12 transporter
MENTMKTNVFSAIGVLCAFIIIPPYAVAGDVSANDVIIITASRYETSVAKEGKDITVITAEEIKDSGKKDVSQVLESVPGITVSKGSGIDSIFIRGSRRGNVLILIDGVKVSDPFGIDKVVDLSLIKTDNIDRIEVVEGSMSSIYGSEASIPKPQAELSISLQKRAWEIILQLQLREDHTRH